MPDLRGYKSPVLRTLGITSLRQFYKDLRLCSVYTDNQQIFLQRYRPARDGRGFELVGLPVEVIKPNDLGQLIDEALRDSDVLNPSLS